MAQAAAPAASDMTARDALHALGDLPRYEERLSMRTGGLTCMVWGIATAGIFMTYAAASDLLEANEAYWGFALLWIPWVVAGSWASAALWRSQAVTLRRDPGTASGIRISVVITLLYLVVAAGLFGALDVLAGVEWTVHSLMAVASGLCAFAVGVWQRSRWGAGARNLIVAGVAMAAGAVLLGLSSMGETASGLAAASLVGVGWFAAGVVTYRAG